MWLDGLYMGEPFYAEYAMLFHEDTAFNDIAKQFILMENHARDAKTGLLYHGWDECKTTEMGQIRKPVSHLFSGQEQWVGMEWPLLMHWIIFLLIIRAEIQALTIFLTALQKQ